MKKIANLGLMFSLILSVVAQAADVDFRNHLQMPFVRVPAGTFLMGAPVNSDVFTNEKPQHQVTITKPFYIAQYEVTQAEWEKVMGINPYDLPRSNPFYLLPGMKERITHPNYPATISWEDAQEFIRRLNQLENTTKYRLPTEAEWEYAVRAGSTSIYFFGNDEHPLGDYAWYGEDFITGGSHSVGLKKPNAWGLYDVYGNVWEWVQDFYSEDYYHTNESIDPKGPSHGDQHVVRGGSWHITSDAWRSTNRKGYDSDYRGISIGIRLVRDLD